MMRTIVIRLVASATLVAVPAGVIAQEPVSVVAEFLFYGDNTEFSNPFRDGETLLGNSGELVLDAGVGGRATIRGGVFGDRRFGSQEAFEIVRPVFSLELRAGPSRFIFGTLETARQPQFGPDRAGPHGLLPPIQRETIGFTRPYEAGLQWNFAAARVRQEGWLNWQRLNTPAGREVFDAGLVGRARMTRRVSFGYQWHLVHHGGQLFAAGPVGDSWVVAPGIVVESPEDAELKTTFEAYGLVSRHVPDRERLDRAMTGAGVFTRGAVEKGHWRGHMIVWRSNDFLKEEGDANYAALRLNGRRYRRMRDYAEIGVTRTARPVARLNLEGSARLHRIENHYEYSYRILGRVSLSWRLR